MDERLAVLEEKIAFLEQALHELSEEHFAQQKDIDGLLRRVARLTERLSHQSDNSGQGIDTSLTEVEKPPHY
jgi:uncharacterized coiled-coil protein SlyX